MSITAAVLICLAPVVYDGDTFKCGDSGISVRLFGIQAPERNTTPVGEHALASENLRQLVRGGLVCEPRGTNWSRIVAVCRNAAGVDLGRAQIEAGHATEWCAYSKNYYGRCPQ
ncbi:MAG TPA: thermonuclease family protein [Chloroflexota bacterium]|nr:thermonuclease family protein [Chloroflexota bacterium]